MLRNAVYAYRRRRTNLLMEQRCYKQLYYRHPNSQYVLYSDRHRRDGLQQFNRQTRIGITATTCDHYRSIGNMFWNTGNP